MHQLVADLPAAFEVSIDEREGSDVGLFRS